MLPSERKQRILTILRERREASVQALAEMLQEPAANVRRDLRELAKQNRISRRHGLAIFRPTLLPGGIEEESELDATLVDELVAETTRSLRDNRNLFLTGGPILLRVARNLTGKTIATHDLGVAMAAAAGGNDVTVIGREIDNQTMTLRSNNLEAEVQQFGFDALVLETDGIDDKNLWVARKNFAVLSALMTRADVLVGVAKSTTLGRKGDRVAGALDDADLLIIDRGASESARLTLADAGVELRIAGESDEFPYAFDQVGNLVAFKRGGGFGGGSESDDDYDD